MQHYDLDHILHFKIIRILQHQNNSLIIKTQLDNKELMKCA